MNKKNPISKGPVGAKPPAPKVPKPKDFKNYEKALGRLDGAVMDAIQVFVDGLKSDDPYYRYNCAAVILRKVVPDRKVKEIVGNRDRPISFEFTDMREAMENAIDALDEMDIEMIQKGSDASRTVFEPLSRGETGTEKEMEEKEGTFVSATGAEIKDRGNQGNEGSGASETGF